MKHTLVAEHQHTSRYLAWDRLDVSETVGKDFVSEATPKRRAQQRVRRVLTVSGGFRVRVSEGFEVRGSEGSDPQLLTWYVKREGPKPMENLLTWIPCRRAAKKCPHSWTVTIAARTVNACRMEVGCERSIALAPADRMAVVPQRITMRFMCGSTEHPCPVMAKCSQLLGPDELCAVIGDQAYDECIM